jgi:hypothetical protein
VGSAFAFFGLIAVQGTLMNILPAGLFRRITPVVQVGALCLTLVALFAYPKGISLLKAHDPWLVSAAVSFLGLAQTIGGQPEPVWKVGRDGGERDGNNSRVGRGGVSAQLLPAPNGLEQASEVAGTPSLFNAAYRASSTG